MTKVFLSRRGKSILERKNPENMRVFVHKNAVKIIENQVIDSLEKEIYIMERFISESFIKRRRLLIFIFLTTVFFRAERGFFICLKKEERRN